MVNRFVLNAISYHGKGAIKEIPGVRIYAAVDGGMTDNPRYALYQSEYEALAANKAADPKTMTVTLAGKCCESGDLLGEGMPVQQLESGDIVSVLVADYQGMGETVIPPELQYVEVISVTASSGYDANTGEAVEDEKELPSTVTLLVTTEQAKVLAGLEQESELHLALVYRGTPENASAFIEAQDALIEELYAEPEAEETAEATENIETGESEGTDPAAESEAAAE